MIAKLFFVCGGCISKYDSLCLCNGILNECIDSYASVLSCNSNAAMNLWSQTDIENTSIRLSRLYTFFFAQSQIVINCSFKIRCQFLYS